MMRYLLSPFKALPHALVLGFCAVFLLAAPARGHEDVTDLVAKVQDSVVNVSSIYYRADTNPVEERLRRFFPDMPGFPRPRKQRTPEDGDQEHQEPQKRSEGSGFIVSKDGYIVTSFHVVDGADKIIVSLQDRRELTAEIVGLDQATDLALLKVEAENLPYTVFGDSDALHVGQQVVAIGSPFQLNFSVTAGVISALGRAVESNNRSAIGRYVPFIQSDVATNPGNSGGPLYSMDGRVIGVNAQIYTRSGGFMGLSFAVPSNVVKTVIKQLQTSGKVARGFLGVNIQDVSRELAESMSLPKPVGALISVVLEDSPATGTLQVGDVIVQVNRTPIQYARDLPPAVGQIAPGAKGLFVLYRNGKRREEWVTVGALPDETSGTEQAEPSAAAEFSAKNRLGMSVKELSSAQKDDLKLDSGVVIVEVEKPSPASRSGLQAGDILLTLNGKKLDSISRFDEIQAQLPKGRPAWLSLRRGRVARILTLRPRD
ncbi:MAG: Do family serine endopeptidase [Gammaproteobacteria bacterium]